MMHEDRSLMYHLYLLRWHLTYQYNRSKWYLSHAIEKMGFPFQVAYGIALSFMLTMVTVALIKSPQWGTVLFVLFGGTIVAFTIRMFLLEVINTSVPMFPLERDLVRADFINAHLPLIAYQSYHMKGGYGEWEGLYGEKFYVHRNGNIIMVPDEHNIERPKYHAIVFLTHDTTNEPSGKMTIMYRVIRVPRWYRPYYLLQLIEKVTPA